jgi:hypothetical protein
MFPDDESSEEHPDNLYQGGSYEDDAPANPIYKGCLIIIAVILILSLLLRYLQ